MNPDDTVAQRLRVELLPAEYKQRSLPDQLTLRGKRVLVVGGAGPNLGRACSERLASLGAQLVIVDRDESAAIKVASDIAGQWGVAAHAVFGDVTWFSDVTAFVAESTRLLGGLDVLVHNAGGARIDGDAGGPFVSTPMELHDAVISLNLLAVMHTLHAVLPGFIEQGAGKVVIVASEGGKIALPHRVAYSAAKSGVLGLVRSLAEEVGRYGVLVNAVCPGTMLSDELIDQFSGTPADAPAVLPLLKTFERIKLGRCCHPEEVANIVAMLATDAASYIQGQAISVSGGMAD